MDDQHELDVLSCTWQFKRVSSVKAVNRLRRRCADGAGATGPIGNHLHEQSIAGETYGSDFQPLWEREERYGGHSLATSASK